jgi:O-succinylhomoserine sulfhydrylase
MLNLSFCPKLRATFERTLGAAQLYQDYLTTKDQTTLRIRKTRQETPWRVYPDSAPESGRRYYSSLRYPTAAAAQAAFARPSHSLVYGRDGTPDGDALTKALLQLDTAAVDGRVTGHGMGAIEAALLAVKSGEHVVASRFIFGTTRCNFLDLAWERGISVTFVDGRDSDAWEAAIQPGKTRLFFFEPVGNPGMERVDGDAVAAIAHKDRRDILVVSDNSMTPLDQSLSRGADMVASSTTKLLGLGIDNGGAILLARKGQERLQRLFPDQPAGYPVLTMVSRKGWTQSHRSARAMLRQAAVSVLRVRRQTATAVALARALADLALKVQSTALEKNAPDSALSSLFAIDLGSQENAFRFIDGLARQGIGIVNNFGSTRTTVIHPGTTTQSSLTSQEQAEQGISPGLVRVSVGLERLSFLIKTFARALSSTNHERLFPLAAHPRQPPRSLAPLVVNSFVTPVRVGSNQTVDASAAHRRLERDIETD